MSSVDLVAKHQQIVKVVKVAVVMLTAALTVYIAWYAVLGLIGWALAAAIWLTISSFAPAVGIWAANMRIAAIKAVIEANPIETLENLAEEKTAKLKEADLHIRDFSAEVMTFAGKVAVNLKKYGAADVADSVILCDKLKVGLQRMKDEQAAARIELDDFLRVVDKSRDLWELQKSANAMIEKSQAVKNMAYEDLKKKISYDTIQRRLNMAFASLDMALEQRTTLTITPVPENAPKAIAAVPDIIDAPTGDYKKVSVNR